MDRRSFIRQSGLVAAFAAAAPGELMAAGIAAKPVIMTVRGERRSGKVGMMLTHEHVMSNFGLDPGYIGEYEVPRLKSQVVPYLKKVKSLGCDALVECTTAYFGRNVKLLKEISEETGLDLITNTGWYAAAKDRYVPEKAYRLSTDEIAAIWIDEWENGINGTDIRPGFIKLAVDNGPISEIDRKLVIAGAKAHKATGLLMLVHTGNSPEAAFAQLKAIGGEGVAASAWVWTHAHNVKDAAPLLEAAAAGAWISLDGLRAEQERQDHIFGLLTELVAEGYQEQILLSHDGNAFPRGGDIRPFDVLMTEFIPRLKSEGFSEGDIHQLTAVNPGRAFAIHTRTT